MRDYQKDLEVCEKATEGPWEWTPEERGCDPETGLYGEPPSYFVHSGNFYINPVTKEQSDMFGYTAHSNADAEFIALARTALPWYINHCIDLESQLHQCREREAELSYLMGEECHGCETMEALQKYLSPSQPSKYDKMLAVVEAAKDIEMNLHYNPKRRDGDYWNIEKTWKDKLIKALATLDSEGVET